MSPKHRHPLAKLARSWLDGAIPTDVFAVEYFRTRRCLLDTRPELFTGSAASLISNLDTAINIYETNPMEPYELDDAALRRELEPIVKALEQLEPRNDK